MARDPAAELARRLRTLREERHATQAQLAAAFRVSVPLISSWETTTVPPTKRLNGYALLFAPGGPLRPSLPTVNELTPAQRRAYDSLHDELLSLRDATQRPVSADEAENSVGHQLLRFPEGEPVLIVCGEMPDITVDRPYTNPDHPDYDEFYTFADPRALMELYGELRRLNPLSEIEYKKSTYESLSMDDYTKYHVMVVGGIDWNTGAKDLAEHVGRLPVRQLPRKKIEDLGTFVVRDGEQETAHRSKLTDDGRLAEDVIHFYRGPNPFAPSRTVTLFNGNYARGTLGAVRALTHPEFRDRNQGHAGTQQFSEFSILMRAIVVRNEIVIPNWTVESLRLHEWWR